MSTRTIVTSQPDVACDVCERRLLRGEQWDLFVDAGRRRLVCELCAPRALHQGWTREAEQPLVTMPPLPARRGRSFFGRLRLLAWPPDSRAGASRESRGRRPRGSEPSAADAEPSELLGELAAAGEPAPPYAQAHAGGHSAVEPFAAPVRARGEPERAIEIFNSSEFPRRVAGVTRSLGAPEVSVRSAEHAASVVRIVVAWELCWYRYEVDLDELDAAVRLRAQGTELSELAREERRVNARAEDSGALTLASP